MSLSVPVTLSAAILTAPTGAGDTVLFDSTTFPSKRQAQMAGLRSVVVNVKSSHDGAVELHRSDDRGSTWIDLLDTTAVTGGTPATVRYTIESYDDFRIVWAQGAVTQTTWEPSLALSPEITE